MNVYEISSLPQKIFEAPTKASDFENSYLETALDIESITSKMIITFVRCQTCGVQSQIVKI